MDIYRQLLRDESVNGERVAWVFRWILYSVLVILAAVVYFVQQSLAGFYGMGLAIIALIYNSFLTIIITKNQPHPWIRFVSVSLDIGLLTVYNAIDSAFNSALVPVTTATLILYPLLIFLAALRLDRKLIVYASVLSVISMNALYFYFYPQMDREIASVLISADVLGQVYRSFYTLMCGLMMFFIPGIVERLLKAQKKFFDESLDNLQLANTDKLTGLSNRRLLDEYLPGEIARSKRDGTKTAILYMDLDGFKPINDRLGHEAGDMVLVAVAQRLKTAVRTGDLVARFGGDEFVVVVHMANSDELLDTICNRIRDSLRVEIPLEKGSVYIDVSIGRSFFPDDGDSSAVLVEKADIDMLQRKAEKKRFNV